MKLLESEQENRYQRCEDFLAEMEAARDSYRIEGARRTQKLRKA